MSSNLRFFPTGTSARIATAAGPRGSGLDQPTDLAEVAGILRARAGMIGAITLLFLAGAIAYIITTPTAYRATVSVIIDTRGRPAPTDVDTTVGLGAALDTAAVETQIRLISSPPVLGRVVDAEHLADDPDFTTARPGLVARLTGATASPPPADAEARRAHAIETLAAAIAARRSERSYVVDLDVAAGDPEKARRLADAVAKAYVTDLQASRETLVERDMGVVTQRLADLRSKVDEASRRVSDFRAANGIADANGRNVLEQQLSNATDDLTRARERTTEAKTRYEQIQRLERAGRPADAVGDALKSPSLERLRGQYADLVRQQANLGTTLGARHPAMAEVENQIRDVRRLIAEEVQRVAAGAANEYQVAREAEADSAKRVEDLRKSVEGRSQVMLQLKGLEREADTTRTTYERYLKVREANSEGPAAVVARIISPASTPTFPFAPRRTVAVAIALFAGLFTGIVVALVLDFLGRSIGQNGPARPVVPPRGGGTPPPGERMPVQASVLADLPLVVARPRRGPGAGRRGAPSANIAERADVGDPARWQPSEDYLDEVGALWAALALPITRGRCVRLLVTSLAPGAGKTFFALALARVAAQSGVPTLLVDANEEAPALVDALPPEARAGLVGDADAPRVGFVLREPGAADLCIVPLVDDEDAYADELDRDARAHGDAVMPETARLALYDGGTIAERDVRELARDVDYVILVVGADERAWPIADVAAELGIGAHAFLGTVRSPFAAHAA